MTIADTQFETIQTPRRHRRSSSDLLMPLDKVAAGSPKFRQRGRIYSRRGVKNFIATF